MSKNMKRSFFFFACFCFTALFLFAENGLVIYVDTGVKASKQKGTVENPFSSFEQAVMAANAHINSQRASVKKKFVPVSIFLRSNVYVEEAVFLTIPLKVSGIQGSTIIFGENAGFVVERASLEIKGCSIRRSERFTEPRTVPVVYGSHGTITLNGVSIIVKEGGDAVILRDSRLICTDSTITSEQSSQAVLVRAEKSSVSSLRSTFSASGLMALCFDFVKTQCTLADTVCSLSPRYTGRVAELTGSTVKAQQLRCTYTSPLFETMDTAVLADTASQFECSEPLELTGFTEALVRR